jgi:hypothetical protein
MPFNKTLLFGELTIGGLFWIVKKYFAAVLHRKRSLVFIKAGAGDTVPLGKEGGSRAALLRRRGIIFINLLTFWSSSPASGILSAQYRQISPTRRFSKMHDDWMVSSQVYYEHEA